MGSFNFGIFPMAAGISEFKHDWEKPYLENTTDFIFKNTFADIEAIVGEIGARGTRFEFECYDAGHLYNLAHFMPSPAPSLSRRRPAAAGQPAPGVTR